MYHNAGACFPFPAPLGCLEHVDAVNELIEEYELPQYLHVYLLFSLPSYSLCLPFPAPFGCREHVDAVNDDTLEYLFPQYSQ
jgi:hypothetical protein